MIDEATYDQLDRYFHSGMNEQERSAFELKMDSDKALREEYDWIHNMLGGMKSQGRSVMKQTIATALSGISAAEVVKYSPSVNGKSFLKKYWVAITVAVVAVGVAISIYAYVNQHKDPVQEGDVNPLEVPASDSSPGSSLQSVALPEGGGFNVDTSAPMPYSESGKKTKYPPTQHDDTVKEIVTKPQISRVNGESQVAMNAQIVKSSPPYSYILTDRLILKSNYASTAGFVFTGKGDTFYMIDNLQQHFMLLKGKGEQPLVPLRGANK
jgi:hypothetical protein